MKEIFNSKITIKKSKFFSHLFSIESESELKDIVNNIKNTYNKSAHICYGAIINKDEIFKNDGEVGQPGKALLSILKNKNSNNMILIVARYYGGIKLGPAGVGKAFKKSGLSCFN